MKVVRDTPPSYGACVYEVSSNYVERIKTYGPDKQKVNTRTDTRTDGHTDNPRHTIIRPVDDGRIKTKLAYLHIKNKITMIYARAWWLAGNLSSKAMKQSTDCAVQWGCQLVAYVPLANSPGEGVSVTVSSCC
jgi:hypothetical protein